MRSFSLAARRAALCALIAWCVPPQAAAADPATAPSFREAVALAWARFPQRQNFAAAQAEAAARDESGRAFFPNAPTASGSYVNDRIAGSNLDYITAEGELTTPIWLPGEGSATRQAAHADEDATAADADAAHLDLALRVLATTEQAVLASNAVDVARRRATTAQLLSASLAHRLRLGESSQSDALAVQAEAASARMTASTARSQLNAVQAELIALTGQPIIPRLAGAGGDGGPVDVSEAAVLAHHPRVLAAERAMIAAQDKARLTRIENRDSPELGVQAIDEKQPGSRWDTRVGVVFRLPFATEARNAPRRAAAEQAVTHAMVAREMARREVLTELRQAQSELGDVSEAALAAKEAANALMRRRGQIERAWRLGEMSLIEVVRADAMAFDADLANQKAETVLQAARLRLRLAAGELP
jgi:outer membrane protein TolC